MARLVTDLKIGESLELEGGVIVTLMQKSGQLAKLCFDRDGDEPMQIRRYGDRRSIPREGEPGRRATDGK